MKEIRALTSLRGLAAVAIVWAHFAGHADGAWLRNGFTSHAYLAVDVFLLLSGFVLAGAYGESCLSLRGYGRYLWRRFWRLFPLHVSVMAAIVAIWPIWSTSKVLLDLALMHRWGTWQSVSADEVPTVSMWAYINSPTWSLSCEWLLNLLLPVLALTCLRSRVLAVVSAIFAAVLLGTVFLRLGGTIEVWRGDSILPLYRCAAFFIFGMLTYRCRAWFPAMPTANRLLSLPPLYFLGEISYSLYLTHAPILRALGVTWASVALVAAVPVLTYYLIERPARGWARQITWAPRRLAHAPEGSLPSR